MQERRWSRRSRVLKVGTITFGGAAISCIVRNLSTVGALLDVESPLGIPRRFTLLVASDSFAKECRVIWIKEKRVGVSFEQPNDGGVSASRVGT